ncbi:MAG: hypothetical protein GYA17_19280, partial [Chloroflexi bacterium]|nr:hypothetical protein [Chloroflexota bacterium]
MLDQDLHVRTRSSVDMPALVQGLLDEYRSLWWSLPTHLPDLGPRRDVRQQAGFEKQLDRLLDGLVYQVKHAPSGANPRLREELYAQGTAFAIAALGLEERHIQAVRKYRLVDVSALFARLARSFDPAISDADIYQASRNVMTMNFIQLLLGLPVEMTPAIFAYSMLYPYTDNYLDDPGIEDGTKRAFNQHFYQRLNGEMVAPANAMEKIIYDLIEMIEWQYDRRTYPQVYDSLLAIYTAQARSLALCHPGAAPYELDVLGISFEKGGTSVLADGYLVAGDLTPEQARLTFGYGAFTQLMDDLEDTRPDRDRGWQTVFSQTAGRWPLDALTSRCMHFGDVMVDQM